MVRIQADDTHPYHICTVGRHLGVGNQLNGDRQEQASSITLCAGLSRRVRC
jgi:hypothetical protein